MPMKVWVGVSRNEQDLYKRERKHLRQFRAGLKPAFFCAQVWMKEERSLRYEKMEGWDEGCRPVLLDVSQDVIALSNLKCQIS